MKNWLESLDPKLISCIIPTFNRPNELHKTLYNITSAKHFLKRTDQSYNVEVILINDGGEVDDYLLDAFGGSVDIHLINLEKNSGSVCIPRNIGISHANGGLLAPIDDDVFTKDSKFVMATHLLEHSLMIYGGRQECIFEDLKLKPIREVMCDDYINRQTDVGIDNGQMIYRADVYKYISPIFSINACDYHTYSEFAPFTDFIYYPHLVCEYVWHENNISRTPKAQRPNPKDLLPNYLKYFKDNEFKQKVINDPLYP